MIVDNFVDYVKLTVSSGKGGKGSTHLRREKFVPKGGPDGGDGGSGGNIILKGNSNLWTLQSFRYKKHFKAGNGGDGSGSRKSGSNGEDVVINVPLGTVIKDLDTEKVICEINDESSDLILLKGGKGGRGNFHFKTPTNQTPRYSQSGLPGKELKIILELKVLADVGLVGYPNAGKSTLLSVLSDAKPKIADYEFTTLKPNLGIVAMSDFRSFVMADIPGIIEGASEGRGLGHYFLRHIERNSILLYVIPVDTKNIKKDFTILQKELIKYNPELADKDFIIAFSKADLMDQELLEEFKAILNKEFKGMEYHIISSISNFGINEIKENLWNKLNQKNWTMNIKDSQKLVDEWIKEHGVRYFNELTNMAILSEEVGEVAKIIARKYGEQSLKENDIIDDLGDELSDVLFVIICLANQTGIDLEKSFKNNLLKKTKRDRHRHKSNNKLK